MDYRLIYDKIICRGKMRVLAEYTESHHILPRCLGGTDDPDNLVELTPEEHYLCHQLLVKMHPENVGILRAAMFMTANGMGRRSNKIYGWLKRQYSEYMRGPNNPQRINPRIGKNHHYFGKKRSPSNEWLTLIGRKSLSDKMKGDKNPCAGVKPWHHPRATDYSKSVWSNADTIYQIWLNNDKPSYCRLYTLLNNDSYTKNNKVIGPYMNMVKYFRNGWIPLLDDEWNNFTNPNKD